MCGSTSNALCRWSEPSWGPDLVTKPPQDVALAISTSSPSPSIALRLPDGSITVLAPPAGANHLVATIESAFAEHGLAPGDLAELRVDLGPGTYTGLRVAMTFALMIRAYGEIPVRTATSLELGALATWTGNEGLANRVLRPVLDARRNRFHHASIRLDHTVITVDPPRATSKEELLAAITPDEVVLADPSIHELLQGVSDRGSLLPSHPWNASLLFDRRLDCPEADEKDLQPLYLMGSYAE